MDCIFCKIINGDIPCYKLYEDDNVLVFLDVNPKENGHTLVIPKKHILDLTTIDNETLLHIINTGKEISNLLKEKLGINGFSLMQNNGNCQEVKHFHLHIIPSYEDNQELIDVKEIYDKIMS